MATTYDINYFIFEIDITEDNTVIQLKNNRRGDTTEWDNITYWGDGTSDTNTTHTYNIGKYTIKSKLFTYRDNESGVNSNRYVTNVFSINKNITDCYRLFYDCNKLTSLDVSNFNTSNVTDMRSMFNNCRLLTSLDLSNFDTSNVVTMYTMFYNCKSLTSLNVSSFNTSKVTTMAEMFKNCSSLTSLDVSHFNTIKVNNMGYMFCNCNKLTSLDLSNFNTSNVISMLGMFRACSSLISLDLSNFTINDTVNTDKMFHDTPQLQDIGMVYCTKATIEKVSLLIQHTANIYVNSIIPENCTPVEGITFIYDGNIKEMTHEPLRAVRNIKDRYVLIDGKWYIERGINKLKVNNEKFTKVCHGEAIEGYSKWVSENLDCLVNKPLISNYSDNNNFICDTYLSNPTWNVKDNVFIENNKICLIIPSIYNTENIHEHINSLNIIYQLKTPIYEPIDYNPLETYADTTHITTNSTIPCNIIVKNHGYNMVALKENTQYTLYVNKDTTNALTYRLGDYIEINSPSKFTFTTPSTLTDKTLRIDSKGAKVNDLMLIEGTPTNDSVGYFNGLKSSYECERVTDENDVNYGKYKVDIKVVGKNLFNINQDFTLGHINHENGEIALSDRSDNFVKNDTGFSLEVVSPYGGVVTDFIRVNSNSTYKFSAIDSGTFAQQTNICFYDYNKEIISGVNDRNLYTKFNTPNNCCYIRIGFWLYNTSQSPISYTNMQLEERDIATEYEPYFESKQTIYLNSPLLKGDEIVWKDNKIQHYHKMKTVVLDGSDDEEIKRSSVANTDCVRYYIKAKDIKPTNTDNTNFINMYSDKFITNMSSEALHVKNIEGISSTWDNHITISILMSKLSSQDVVGLRQWLQANPVTVVYELETPYYEEISDYPLKLNVIANSSLSTESTIQVTNISFNIYEETLPYLYPNTKYYITFNSDVNRKNIIIDLGGNHVVFDCKVGFNKVEITTPSDTTNLLTFSGTGVNIDHVKVTQQDIDKYFEGMKSVGECEGNIEILSQNKNLFDGIFISGNVAPNGEITPYADRVVTPNYLKINPNVPLFIHGFDNIAYICYYDSDKNVIVRNTYAKDNRPLVKNIPSNAMYIRISIVECTDTSLPMIVEQGNVTEGYIPHQSNSQTLTHEPLRAVGNTKDRYVLIDGKWYIERQCGKIVLDNTNNWVIDEHNDTYYRCRVQIQDKKNNANCITNKYPVKISSWSANCVTSYSNLLYFQVDTSVATDLNTFKQYMGENPITVIYELATPQYEPIDYNPFEVYADTTHITTNSLIPTNVVVKNHGYNCILKPSTKYTIALNKPNGTISAKLGGSAKVDSTNSIFTITTPSTLNDNVLRLSGSGNVKDIMILEGDKTVNTPSYFSGIESVFEQEYDTEKGKYRVTIRVEGNGKESSIIFYINEPLRGVDTAKDKVFIQDGKVIVERNCSSITLDGSKNIHKVNTDFDSVNNISFSIDIDNIASSWVNCNNIVCSTLPNVGNRTWKGNMEGITSNDIIILLCISRNKLQTQDVNGFKQWLQANPTKVVYVLAEPVYEEADCDLSKLVLENYENSSLIFKSNIPVNANIRYSGEVPVVTQAKALSSQVDNTTLDINENIIPYMCDIDYRIVELQLMNGDTQGEGIELLGIGDIEILGNENVLFNNREDKKHNFSYDMLKRDILSQRYSKEEYQYRLDRYLLANKISNEEYKELEGLLNNGK